MSLASNALAEETTISQPSDLANHTDVAASEAVEWVLAGDLSVTPAEATWWTASAPLVSGGDVTWDGQEGPYSLTVSGGASQAFVLPKRSLADAASGDGYSWSFLNLRQLSISDTTSTGADVYGGAVWVDSADGSYPVGTNSLSFSNNGSVSFLDNKADASASTRAAFGGAIYMGGRSAFDMTENGDILFSGNQALGSNTASYQSANGGAFVSGRRCLRQHQQQYRQCCVCE